MAIVTQYLPVGESSPYKVGQELCSLSRRNPSSIRFTYVSEDDASNEAEKSPDVFHLTVSPWVGPRSYWYWLKKYRRQGAMVVTNVHGDYDGELLFSIKDGELLRALSKFPTILLMSIILKKFDYFIVNSQQMSERLQERYRITPSRIFVIPNGMETHLPMQTEGSEGTHETDEFTLFTHGVLSSRKGLLELIDAIEELNDPRIKLLIAGQGPLYHRLDNIIGKKGLDASVSLLGHVPNEKIMECISKSRICIYPSKFDAYNIAALEAMLYSNGVVLVSEKAGITDFFPQALSPNVFSPEKKGIKESISNAMKMQENEVLENRRMQREFASSLSWESVWPQYLRMYDQILENK